MFYSVTHWIGKDYQIITRLPFIDIHSAYKENKKTRYLSLRNKNLFTVNKNIYTQLKRDQFKIFIITTTEDCICEISHNDFYNVCEEKGFEAQKFDIVNELNKSVLSDYLNALCERGSDKNKSLVFIHKSPPFTISSEW